MEKLRAPRQPLKKAGLFVGGGIAALAIACGGGNGTEPQVQNPDTQTPTPDATEPLTPTLAPVETPTFTPEVKQEVPCQILPDEYCSQGKLVDWQDETSTYKLAVADLSAGIPIRAPISGQIGGVLSADNPFNPGSPLRIVEVIDPNSRLGLFYFAVFGDFTFADNINMEFDNVVEGQIIAYTQDTGINVLGGSIAVAMSSHNSEGVRDDISPVINTFPNFSEQ